MEITTIKKVYRIHDQEYEVILAPLGGDEYRVSFYSKQQGHKTGVLTLKSIHKGRRSLVFELNKKLYKARASVGAQGIDVCLCNSCLQVSVEPAQTIMPAYSLRAPLAHAKALSSSVLDSGLRAPLAGKVIKILAQDNQRVTIGQPLVIIESMKMENEICAPCDAIIKTLPVSAGDLVNVGQVLVTFEKKGEANARTENQHGQEDVTDR